MGAGTQAPQSTAQKIRAALDVNAAKAQEFAEKHAPEYAEAYANAALKLAQALSTLEANRLT